jgi:kynurenine formamidase
LAHTLIQSNRNIWDDKLDDFYPQASSQWDGFRHVRARELGFWGGLTEDPPQLGNRLGVEHFARRGIIGRGVLLDIDGHLRATTSAYNPLAEIPVGADLLGEVADRQGVQVRSGDILCLRFGWLRAYRELGAGDRAAYAAAGQQSSFAGLSAEESTARVLWDWHVAAVACDNPGAEVSPGNAATGSLHRRLLPLLGVVVGELLDFEELSQACADRGSWSFLFTAVPLNVAGAVGSPANAVAVL